MELKTLKDITPWTTKAIKGSSNFGDMALDVLEGDLYEKAYGEGNLRKEAIKWITEYRINPERPFREIFPDALIRTMINEEEFEINLKTVYGEKIEVAGHIIECFIKHFFNITEEDFK